MLVRNVYISLRGLGVDHQWVCGLWVVVGAFMMVLHASEIGFYR